MNIKAIINEHTNLLLIIIFLIAIALIIASNVVEDKLHENILGSFGIIAVSAVLVPFLYEKFIAEKHFSLFKSIINEELEKMSNVQSKCTKLGICEIFERRIDYERKYILDKLFKDIKENGRILIVARSMQHIANKKEAFIQALKKGAQIQLAFIEKEPTEKISSKICYLNESQIQCARYDLNNLTEEIEKEQPKGSLEIHTYNCPLPESILFIETNDRDLLIWDMTFSTDVSEKRVFLLEPKNDNLGVDLLKRYNTIWEDSEIVLKVNSGGLVECNKIESLCDNYHGRRSVSL